MNTSSPALTTFVLPLFMTELNVPGAIISRSLATQNHATQTFHFSTPIVLTVYTSTQQAALVKTYGTLATERFQTILIPGICSKMEHITCVTQSQHQTERFALHAIALL